MAHHSRRALADNSCRVSR